MAKSLLGKHIVLGASRKTDEMTSLIEKQGGRASVRSLQGTVYKAENEIEKDLKDFVKQGADWIIFTTGIGIETLLEQAEKLGIKELFLENVSKAKVMTRGYKSEMVLKKLQIDIVAKDDDGTTQGLIRQVKDFDFQGKKVLVQLHGEKAELLMTFLQSKGAMLFPILPYQHIPPEEKTVERLCSELINGEVDAVCFTTAIQVYSLFTFAREKGFEENVKQAFKDRVVATAVGKVTAEALKEQGIERIVVPQFERMGAMIVELARYFSEEKS